MPNVRVPPGRANHADATKLIQFVPSPAASGRLDLLGVNSTQEDIGFLLTSWVLMSAWFAKVICCHATRRPLPGNCSLASAGQRAAASRTPLRLVASPARFGRLFVPASARPGRRPSGRLLGPASPPAAIKARVSGWRAKGGPLLASLVARLVPSARPEAGPRDFCRA